MDVTEHAQYGRLFRAVAGLVGSRSMAYKSVLYRFAKYDFAQSADFLSGQGTLEWGTRYGAAKTFPIVYGSTDYHLALDETCEEYKRYGISSPPLNHVVRAFEFSVAVALDLTSAEVRKSLGVARKTLIDGNWREDGAKGRESLTQATGRAAHANRVQALLVPSRYSSTEHNVAIFPHNLDGKAFMRLVSGS